MKNILVLGGAMEQVIALKTAQEMGYKTILCDRSKNCPGQEFAERFYVENTTNERAILEIAREEKIHGIISYAEDTSTTTVAYVSEKLYFPTNSYKTNEILCNKALYREFLKENGFNTPFSKVYPSVAKAVNEIGFFKLPVMVKPADSSASRGISKIFDTEELHDSLEYAFLFASPKRSEVIVEEYVGAVGKELTGDAIVIDGNVKLMCLGSSHFNKKGKNPYIPIATTFPNELKKDLEVKIKAEVQKLVDKLKIKTSMLNLEIRVDKKGSIYLMEVTPRNGGNYIPQIIKYAMGVDMVDIALKFAMGEKVMINKKNPLNGYFASFVISSEKRGKLKSVVINEEIQKNIVEQHMLVENGEEVSAFLSGKEALGVLIMKFETNKEMQDVIKHPERWIEVEVY